MKIVHAFENAIQLGKEVKISPKSLAIVSKPGLQVSIVPSSVMVEFTIGSEEGILLMSSAAWEELKSGSKPVTKTHKQFKKG